MKLSYCLFVFTLSISWSGAASAQRLPPLPPLDDSDTPRSDRGQSVPKKPSPPANHDDREKKDAARQSPKSFELQQREAIDEREKQYKERDRILNEMGRGDIFR